MPKIKDRHKIIIEGQEVEITSPEKPLWPSLGITKIKYLHYLIKISPFLLPFLRDRLLTVIRYPHGVLGESFYQKNCPDYAPNYIKTYNRQNINYIVCSDLPTLIWLGNQVAIDLHTPFNPIHSTKPSEIVFDLDPPSRNEFNLALEAALILKEIFTKFKLISFVKTSGNKGLQIYIPLPDNTFTYDETRIFTEFTANYLVQKEPKWFTLERLKKNRGKRLYIDYLQHAEGKTIIAPYSLRGNEDALVATPLLWKEVTQSLSPEKFPMEHVIERLAKGRCPFKDFEKSKNKQHFSEVLLGLDSIIT